MRPPIIVRSSQGVLVIFNAMGDTQVFTSVADLFEHLAEEADDETTVRFSHASLLTIHAALNAPEVREVL